MYIHAEGSLKGLFGTEEIVSFRVFDSEELQVLLFWSLTQGEFMHSCDVEELARKIER